MSQLIDVVKRQGKRPTETFTREKLHASVVAACLSVKTPAGQTEKIAEAVCDAVIDWLQIRPEVTSGDLRRIAARKLHIHHPDAAYIYEQHRIII